MAPLRLGARLGVFVFGRRLNQEAASADRYPAAWVKTIIGSLGSDPERVLETDSPSPGEMRKLLLATGVLKCPYLIIMDEPTNHLDLPSTRALERALDSCHCALILVSHDPVFLDALVKTHWTIKEVESDSGVRRTQLCLGK